MQIVYICIMPSEKILKTLAWLEGHEIEYSSIVVSVRDDGGSWALGRKE